MRAGSQALRRATSTAAWLKASKGEGAVTETAATWPLASTSTARPTSPSTPRARRSGGYSGSGDTVRRGGWSDSPGSGPVAGSGATCAVWPRRVLPTA